MQLKLISWNIRHFRQQKIDEYIHTIWEVCEWADVCFVYEDHTGRGSELAQAFNEYEQKRGPTLSRWRVWMGDEIRVHDEYVALIWKSGISVAPNSGRMAQFGDLMSGERCPAVADVTVKLEHGDRTVTIAAWHAYGPAKVSAKDLFQRLLQTDYCDVLIGDFNFQTYDKSLPFGGLTEGNFTLSNSMDFETPPAFGQGAHGAVGKRSARIKDNYKMQEILPSNHRGSTTYTEEGIGKRTTGLDRCIVLKQHVASVALSVALPREFDEMSSLTDHMPLMLIFEIA